MTDNEKERIAVLETQIQHLREEAEKTAAIQDRKIDKLVARQDEMYNLMMQTKGGWRTLAVLAGVSGLFGGILVKIAPLFAHLPK
ncbi:hypothetical protein IWQ49_006354 [Labrenzia sp. EL_126]|nr:hypothetical protein [Labrenzia sp. EL_126]